MTRIYLAGPMSGLPDFNRSAFRQEASRLRSLGHHVENPEENPAPPCGSWQAYMRLAIAQLVTCDTLAYLPGSESSRGAMIEIQLALSIEMTVVKTENVR